MASRRIYQPIFAFFPSVQDFDGAIFAASLKRFLNRFEMVSRFDLVFPPVLKRHAISS